MLLCSHFPSNKAYSNSSYFSAVSCLKWLSGYFFCSARVVNYGGIILYICVSLDDALALKFYILKILQCEAFTMWIRGFTMNLNAMTKVTKFILFLFMLCTSLPPYLTMFVRMYVCITQKLGR